MDINDLITEITAADKEFQRWYQQSRRIIRVFRDERENDRSGIRKMNLFHANVLILQTTLYNTLPMPYVDREFKDQNDDIGRVAANILERVLTNNVVNSTDLDSSVKHAIQDRLIPGLGQVWLRYEAKMIPAQETTEDQSESLEPDEGTAFEEQQEMASEQVRIDYVLWNDFLFSPARTWEEVRWVARRVYMTLDQLRDRFPKYASQIPLSYTSKADDRDFTPDKSPKGQAGIYELWNKADKNVYWFCKEFNQILDQQPDFMGLEGFWPCPRPLFSTLVNGKLVPIPDYNVAKDQYRELNEVNTRIALLVKACKVAGAYDKNNTALKNILSGDNENSLIPCDMWAALAERGGLKGSMDFLPLDPIVTALSQLYQAREDLKQQIFELTGISDIVRGATKASETLGAQQLKAKYASGRIQALQQEVIDFVTAILQIEAEIIVKHFAPETLISMSGIGFSNDAADPSLIAQAIDLLKSWQQTEYRVEIETDSLSQTDYQQEKAERMDLVQSIGMLLQQAFPAMQAAPQIIPFMGQLIQFAMTGFRVGKKFETQIDQMVQQLNQLAQQAMAPKPPQPPPPDPALIKANAHVQATQMKTQSDIQTNQAKAMQEMNLKQMAHNQDMTLQIRQAVFDAVNELAKNANSANNVLPFPGQ